MHPLLEVEAVQGGTVRPFEWQLVGVSPDERTLVVGTSFGGCERLEGWEVAEEGSRVVIAARMFTHEASSRDVSNCDDVGYEERLTVELDAPLGDRELDGCQLADCRHGPFTRTLVDVGHEVAAAENALVVNGGTEQWSLDPADGIERWRWTERGMVWALAGPSRLVRYDGNYGIDLLDAATGDVRSSMTGTPVGFAGDTLVSCRERDEDDPAGVARVTEARDLSTGDLRWAIDLGCDHEFGTDGVVVSFGGRQSGGPNQQTIVRISDGTELARVDLGVQWGGVPVLVGGEVVVRHAGRGLIAIDVATGDLRDLELEVPLLGAAEETLIAVDETALTGRSVADGEVAWEIPVDLVQVRPIVTGGAVFVNDGAAGEVARHDPTTGELLWTADVGRSSSIDIAVHDGLAYAATPTSLVALDHRTGERRWWVPTVVDDTASR
ncbi:PQQ-binding-like beta-propeller repeat protein [Nitriliruptor alkaliphilus]|uniref:outer membrane protein assembly factor BamB family protein n=1 Tax=Nitriliruptor alkaliphilus TaxID=427918 RepID=UPI000697497E|nr:PQQ-binding-like beta-propeller repeat protein [Nitriliruptor alkaliphilus]